MCIRDRLNAYDYEDPRPGFDLIMQAETGFISMNGTEKGELCKMPVAMIDIMASHQIREAILIALLQRQHSQKGSLIHVSLYQSGIASLANQASNYLTAGKIELITASIEAVSYTHLDVYKRQGIICKDNVIFF